MKRTGFTIIELIVIIAIIALLTAITLPTLRSSKLHAQTILCASNLKQLQLALSMYESENQTFPLGLDNSPMQLSPPPGGYAGNGSYDRCGWWWFNLIGTFYKRSEGTKTILQCPSKSKSDPRARLNILWGNYGVNRSIFKSYDDIPTKREFAGKPPGISSIPYPSQTLLIVDSGYAMIIWWHAADVPPVSLNNDFVEDAAYIPGLRINNKRLLWPGQEIDAIYGRHPLKTVNAGFADGRVDTIKADDLLVEKKADSYINKIPLWQPK